MSGPHLVITLPAILAEAEPEFGGDGWTVSFLISPSQHARALAALRRAADEWEAALPPIPDYRSTHRAYLLSAEWHERQERALERAGRKCQACSTTASLQVHHNSYARVGHELETDLFVMCDDCHGKIHGATAA
jgi:hypothetical protein